MGAWQRARRNRRTTKVKVDLLSRNVTDAQRPAALLLPEGDLALETLIVTAVELIDDRPGAGKSDEKAITQAVRDRERVASTFRLVVHAVAARATEAGSNDGEWALGRLRETYPLAPAAEEELDIALRSFDLGLGDVDTNLAKLVFAQLLGEERMLEMVAFNAEAAGTPGLLVDEMFRRCWDRNEEGFLKMARSGPGRGHPGCSNRRRLRRAAIQGLELALGRPGALSGAQRACSLDFLRMQT